MTMTSPNDITIICFPLQLGKPHACAVVSCQCACASIGVPALPTLVAMHEPSHQILDPDF